MLLLLLLLLLSADNSDNSNFNFFGEMNYFENHLMNEWISVASCIGAVASKKIWGWKIFIITLNLKCMMFLSSFKIQSLCLIDIFLIINLNDRLATVINIFISSHIWLFKIALNWSLETVRISLSHFSKQYN